MKHVYVSLLSLFFFITSCTKNDDNILTTKDGEISSQESNKITSSDTSSKKISRAATVSVTGSTDKVTVNNETYDYVMRQVLTITFDDLEMGNSWPPIIKVALPLEDGGQIWYSDISAVLYDMYNNRITGYLYGAGGFGSINSTGQIVATGYLDLDTDGTQTTRGKYYVTLNVSIGGGTYHANITFDTLY